MLIGDEGRRSNLRVMYGILASTALARLNSAQEGEGRTSEREVYFLNLIRLLEMYRYGTFYSPPPNGVLESKPLTTNQLSQGNAGPESEMVLKAIQAAHASVSDLPRDRFVDFLEVVFDALHRSAAASLDKDSVKKARDFLTCFVAELRKGIDNV
jgi:type II secretory pathway pseudopilin PulG